MCFSTELVFISWILEKKNTRKREVPQFYIHSVEKSIIKNNTNASCLWIELRKKPHTLINQHQFILSGMFIRANRGFLPSKFQKERILMQFYDTLSGKCCALARTHSHIWLRVRFFKKIQDWILKSERIRKKIIRCFTKEINRRFLGSWCLKGTINPLSSFATPW